MPPQLPPRDDDGAVVPYDEPNILDDDDLIRRISEKQTTFDKNAGRRRISSLAFKGSPSDKFRGMSVDHRRWLEEDNIDPQGFVTSPRWIGSVLLQTADVRSLVFKVGCSPQGDNPYHCEVWGEFNRGQIENLRSNAIWFVEIPDVSIA